MKQNIIFLQVLLFLCISTDSFARITPFETTRLQSTSGAGVATILVNETAVLNPAPIVFVPVSGFYYQKGNLKLDSVSSQRTTDFADGSSQMYLLSDSTTRLKGTFSYQDHSENSYRRKRLTSSIATNSGKKTAYGVLYRYTMDKAYEQERSFHQGVFGFTHIHSDDLVIGGVLVDPFLSNKEDALALIGFQYALTGNFFLIVDGGTNFNDDSQNNTVSRGALQVNFFRDLYLRVGQFHDKNSNTKGSSWGISWIGPRISFEYAYKTSEIIQDNSDYLYKDEQILETSLSFALIF